MSQSAVVDFQARVPSQARGRERFEVILKAAENQLLKRGISGLSIPEIAESLEYTRTSIYHYFPTPYAILNELSHRYLSRLEQHASEAGIQFAGMPWETVLQEISQAMMEFHNSNPVGRMLILGAPASSESHQALEMTIVRMSRHVVGLMRSIGVELPKEPVNAAALTVELGTACLRLSYHMHGEITPAYRDECARAMIQFLRRFEPSQS